MTAGPFSALQGPLPLEQLLRSSGKGDPSRGPWSVGDEVRDDDRDAVAGDAAQLLDVLATGVPPAWSTGPFIARVAVARKQLAPIASPVVLEASFGREASTRLAAGRTSRVGLSAIRVAYVLRWFEIVAGLHLPPWEDWIEPCTPAR